MTYIPLLRGARTAVALAAAFALAFSVAGPASAAPRSPSVPSGLPGGIEAAARYVPANSCDPTAKPGTVKLAKLLKGTYPNTSYGISRSCGSVPNSEHLEGRAVDWMNSIRQPTQAAQAKVVLSWLFATDGAGHQRANASRLGVMYVIWNNKIWSAYSADQGWRPYRNCATQLKTSSDTVCHRDHMHISLSWEGAMGRTSFWSKTVARPDYGPCRAADLNWAAPYTQANRTQCTRYSRVVAPAGASSTLKTLTIYSGMVLRTGSKGTAVKAVQTVVKATPDGDFGPQTKAAVQKWQTAHSLNATGVVSAGTWRALLRSTR